MFSFQKHSLLLARRLDIIAALAIFAMMALTSVDIFLRYFFRKPIPGTYEIVALLGAVAVSFAMAHTLAVKGHVAVSLIVQMFPKRLQGIVESFISIFGIILFALIAWQSILYGVDCQRSGEVSMTLQLPFYPIIYGVALGAAVVCLVLTVDLVNAISKVKGK
ncbi:MAG: TRAP transporter small permease [Deltaproteobacteria bacterium]|nr:MAG: TRAP transporter small permease [Deltaproteobacteria bacterium]RLB24933.1 MAG: TRAP transporter small permease [Deltaproteobacteria bacterium]